MLALEVESEESECQVRHDDHCRRRTLAQLPRHLVQVRRPGTLSVCCLVSLQSHGSSLRPSVVKGDGRLRAIFHLHPHMTVKFDSWSHYTLSQCWGTTSCFQEVRRKVRIQCAGNRSQTTPNSLPFSFQP